MLRLVPLMVRTGLALRRWVGFFSSSSFCGKGVLGGVMREMSSSVGWALEEGCTLRRDLRDQDLFDNTIQ